MNKFLLAATAAVALAASAVSANAATIFNLTYVPGPDGSSFSASYGRSVSGAFDDEYRITLPAGLASASVISTLANAATDVNFSSATLNGIALSLTALGTTEIRQLNFQPVNGLVTLKLVGTAGTSGSYGGNISFAVPEPATWALMIGGFGSAGAMLRRRRSALVAA